MTWNGAGLPSSRKRQGFAIEDQVRRRQIAPGLDNLRHRRGHLVQVAREDADLAALLVQLDPGAVELVFEPRLAQLRQRLARVLGGLRKHRLQRPEQPNGHAGERWSPLAQHRPSDGTQVPGNQQRPPDLVDRQPRRRRHGLDHQSLDRALAQRAQHRAQQKILLVGGSMGQ